MIYAGIDLGGTNIKAGLVDENLSLVCKLSVPTEAGRSDQDIIADMANMVIRMANDNGIAPGDIAGVGIGIPGVAKDGIVLALHNLYWHDVPLRAMFQKHLNVPVYINNDGTVAALYEYHAGVLTGCNIGILLTLGTGIGGGIIIGGKPYSGAHGLGGELGHIPIVTGGVQCTCGNKGCFEIYASATALLRYARNSVVERPEGMLTHMAEGDYRNVTTKMVFDCAKRGDYIAAHIVDTYVHHLSMGITALMNSFDPDVIALGGGISGAGDYLLDKVITACEGKGVFEGQKYADIKIAKSGNDAGLVGAAMLAR